MTTFLFTNNAESTLNAGITAVATSIFLNTGDGALFPSPGAGQQFPVTLVDSSNNTEIAYCTARSGDTLTVVRGQEGTTAQAFSAGDYVGLRVTKAILEQFAQKDGNLQATLDADQVDGYDAGNASGNVPVSNGTVNTDLNADQLDGQHGSYYQARANHTGTQTMSTISDAGNLATLDSVGQGQISANAVGQSEIKDDGGTEQSVAVNNGATQEIKLSAGSYMLGSQYRVNSSTGNDIHIEWRETGLSTGYQNIAIEFKSTRAGTGSHFTGYITTYEIQASPPHNLGFGQFDTFVFILLDTNTNTIERTYTGKVAPWHYQGPTSIQPDIYDNTGQAFRYIKQVHHEALMSGMTLPQYLGSKFADKSIGAVVNRFANDRKILVPIDETIKNADMSIIPHPFTKYDLTNRVVLALNPLDHFVENLLIMNSELAAEDEFSFADEFLLSNRLKIDNIPIPGNGGFDPSVKCVNARLKP